MKSKLFRILGVVAVVAMIATAIVAPVAADVGSVTATVSSANNPTVPANQISAPGNYSIYFTPSVQLGPTDTVTITFPAAFTVGTATASIAASSGWVTGVYTPAVVTATTYASTGQTVVFTLGAGDKIGSQAQVLVNISAGVTNPATAGSYSVTVATKQETNAVTSSTFAIVNPTIPAVAGVATVFNSAGIQLTQTNDVIAAINAVTDKGTIKLTAGTYNTNFSTSTGLATSFTLQGTDASAANVILKSTGAWALTGKTVVIDSVTIDGSTGALTVGSATAAGTVTVSNSNILKGALTVNAAGAGATSTLSKDTFTVKSGALTGLVASTGVTVTGPARWKSTSASAGIQTPGPEEAAEAAVPAATPAPAPMAQPTPRPTAQPIMVPTIPAPRALPTVWPALFGPFTLN